MSDAQVLVGIQIEYLLQSGRLAAAGLAKESNGLHVEKFFKYPTFFFAIVL